MRPTHWITLFFALTGPSACTYRWVAQSTTASRAFIASGGHMMFCDAVGGHPRCRTAAEVPR